MYKHQIGKNLDEAMDNFRKKNKIVDEVSDMSKKMKLKYESKPDENHFKSSMTVNRLVHTARPTKSSMIGRKNIAFSSLIE